MYAEDTIAAIATAPGEAGVGIVRVSGPLTRALAARLFSANRPVDRWPSHRLHFGRILDAEGRPLDEGLAVLMRRPRSYTGEDVLEFHCHGSPIVLRGVLTAVLRLGARLADPGEFTKRAFLNGRIDLTQAEAVVDLVRARSTAAARLAIGQLSGVLSAHLESVRAGLIRLKALLEAQIDFSDEDVSIADQEVGVLTTACHEALTRLVESYTQGRLVREGALVPIVGKPNVGKSSLLNALLGEQRSIVTPMPGTTRDTIEEGVSFGGIPVSLIDTAGLRAAEEADDVERLGMQRTALKVAAAQAVLCVVDRSAPLDRTDQLVAASIDGVARVVVANKSDLARGVSDAQLESLAAGGPVVHVSALTGEGLDGLREAVVQAIGGGGDDGRTAVVSNARQQATLRRAAERLGLAAEAVGAGLSPELVAVDVQEAIDQIAALTGAVTSEDVLDRIFSEFCIGK